MKTQTKWIVFTTILIASCLIVSMSFETPFAKEAHKVIEVSSTKQVAKYFDSIGYNVTVNPSILKAIPRFQFTHVPRNWKKETSIPLKKSVFFRAGASAILQVNELILFDRKRLLGMNLKTLSKKDRQWLAQMMAKYKVTENKDTFTL